MILKTRGTDIVSGNKKVRLRGVNFGGWLMMEAYFLHAPHQPEKFFRKGMADKYGEKVLEEFDREFRGCFIQEEDFRRVAKYGFNCIRLPFHHRVIETRPNHYDPDGVALFDKIISWAKRAKVYLILDLHAAPGSQNHDWHSDSDGRAEFWQQDEYRRRTISLWEFLADRYKSEEIIAGYDLLNEPVLHDIKLLNEFYRRLITNVRKADPNHIFFVEGNTWSQDIACLEEFDDDNYALSVHFYHPLEYTFNYIPHATHPFKLNNVRWDKKQIRRHLAAYSFWAKKRRLPIFVGEFGVNYRGGFYGEDQWLKDTLDCFNDFGFHWTYWTYKAVKNSFFPDGIFSYYDNPPWVNRGGALTGWETYKDHWADKKKDMVASWDTAQFKENAHILKVLKNGLR